MVFEMKGSPHKRGAIKGTSAHKASAEIIEAAAGAYARPVTDISGTVEATEEISDIIGGTASSVDSEIKELKKKFKNGEIDEATYKKRLKELKEKKII